MAGKTLFDKIWDSHVVQEIPDGPSVLYIDRHLIHEVTSPQAFNGLGRRGLSVMRPKQTVATPDHNVPTINQDQPIEDELSKLRAALAEKKSDWDLTERNEKSTFRGLFSEE